jgi:hypothetical protein
MTYTSIDRLTRSVLQRLQLPIHYYVQVAKYIVDELRDLRLHTLGVINTAVLPVTSYGAIELPCDFVDWLKVGLPYGQFIRELVSRDAITRLTNHDTTTGDKIPYGTSKDAYRGGGVSSWESTINDLDEGIGRYFGIRQGEQGDTFKLIRERAEIQLHESITAPNIVLEYISSGEGEQENTATQVDWRASSVLELAAQKELTGLAFQRGQASGSAVMAIDRKYGNALRILRAQIADLGEEDVLRIIRDAYSTTIKN